MSYPTHKEIEIPLLTFILSQGGTIECSSCYNHLASEFGLTTREREQYINGKQKWPNMVQWARNSLLKNGLIYSSKEVGQSIWKLTEKGISEAKSLVNKKEVSYPDEIGESVFEGAQTTVIVNKYERNKSARATCIKFHGHNCSVCRLNFEEKFGSIGKDFIHVHHVKPISSIGHEYKLDPIKDLIPVCPNCHAMLHREDPPLTIEKLKNILNDN